jgi:hypothetical protein
LGHVPSKKNRHYVSSPGKNGKRRVLMDAKTKQWTDKATANFVFQLLSKYATTEGGTVTEHSLQSLIASLPPDDAWQFIPVLAITATTCQPTQEGAEITIERLAP